MWNDNDRPPDNGKIFMYSSGVTRNTDSNIITKAFQRGFQEKKGELLLFRTAFEHLASASQKILAICHKTIYIKNTHKKKKKKKKKKKNKKKPFPRTFFVSWG